MDLWDTYFKWIIFFMLTFTLVPYLTAIIASWLGHISKRLLVQNLGPNAQLAVGGLGVAIHEFGHASFAIIFGHHIQHVQLLNFRYAQTGSLGSVEHTWNQRNVYQRLGNFFIGLAPYYMCSIALYGLQKLLLHSNLNFGSILESNSEFSVNTVNNIFSVIGTNLITMFNQASIVTIVIYFILTVMIASTGYDLSSADLHTVIQGLTPWLVVLAIISIILTILGMQSLMGMLMSVVIVFSILFLIQALFYILISIIFLQIVGLF